MTMMKPILILAALLALAACAGNVELQHEASGSDEMLKSPCACILVPYDAPAFTWGRG
jgi:hypothetical protein